MIEVADIVGDADMVAPEPWTIQRSTGSWSLGGFASSVTSIPCMGPVRVASDREIEMIPEADRRSSLRAFYATQPLNITSGSVPAPTVHTEVAQGAVPGNVFTLSGSPLSVAVLVGGNFVTGFSLDGSTLTLDSPVSESPVVSWYAVANGASVSDVIVYLGRPHRILRVYRTQGSGYWKAIATDTNAA